VTLVLVHALRNTGPSVAGATATVEALGQVGRTCPRPLSGAGCRMVAVSDSRGEWRCDASLHLGRLEEVKLHDGRLAHAKVPSDAITCDELLPLPVTARVPAVVESTINAANVNAVPARIVAEGASGPSTPTAETMLTEDGVVVVPHILASAGAVTVSCFDWVQDLHSFL
jgi:glutamate dehydrogenase